MEAWKTLIAVPIFTAKDGSHISARLDVLIDKKTADEVERIFTSRGGQIVHRPNPFTIALSDRIHERDTPQCPIFDVQWVFDCTEAMELLDIQAYLLNKTEYFAKRNFLDVIYHKIETIDGTLLAVPSFELDRDSIVIDEVKECRKPKRRRGPEPKKDYLVFEVDHLSDEEDFYSELAKTVTLEAVEKKLLIERTSVARMKKKAV